MNEKRGDILQIHYPSVKLRWGSLDSGGQLKFDRDSSYFSGGRWISDTNFRKEFVSNYALCE